MVYPEAPPETAEDKATKRMAMIGQWSSFDDDQQFDGLGFGNPETIEYEVPPEIAPEKSSPPPPRRREAVRPTSTSSQSTSRYRTTPSPNEKSKFVPRAPDRARNNFRLSNMLEVGREASIRHVSEESADTNSSIAGTSASNDSQSSGGSRRQRLMARMKSLSTRSMASLERQRVMAGPSDGIQKTSVASVQERTTSSVQARRTKEELRRSVRQQRLQRILSKRSERRPPQPDEIETHEDSTKTACTSLDTSELEEKGINQTNTHDVTMIGTYQSTRRLQNRTLQEPVKMEEEKKEIEEIRCGHLRYSTKQDHLYNTETKGAMANVSPIAAARKLSSSISATATDPVPQTVLQASISANIATDLVPPPVMRRSLSMSSLAPTPSRSIMKKSGSAKRRSSVRFDRIELREFDQTIGDNPSVSCGVPIQLDWNYTGTSTLTLDDYEEARLPNRRPKTGMALPPEARQEMLLKEWGVSFRELHETASETDNIKKQRYMSAMQTPYQARVEEVLETTRRRVSRVIKGNSKKKEQERLWEHARQESRVKPSRPEEWGNTSTSMDKQGAILD